MCIRDRPEWYCGGGVAEPLIQIPKVASVMSFPLEKGNSLLLINVHLINFEWGISTYQTQLEQLFSFVENHQGPIIMSGDFNAWNERRLNLVNNLIQKYGLDSVVLSQDERVRFLGYPLDYIFTRGVKAVSYTHLLDDINGFCPTKKATPIAIGQKPKSKSAVKNNQIPDMNCTAIPIRNMVSAPNFNTNFPLR